MQVGAFARIFDPSEGRARPWYINDHCFVRDPAGRWRLFGITHEEPAAPLEEKFLVHAAAPALAGPWTAEAPAMPYDPDAGETHIWAPHIVREGGLWWMFYCAGGASEETYRIHAATSPDLTAWMRIAENPLIVDGFGARDPMVLRLGGRWLMYFTATSQPGGGHHVVKAAESHDLRHWRPLGEVFRHPVQGTYGGPTESPFVVAREGRFFLFVCTNRNYVETAVYESASPLRWAPEGQVFAFPAHAAEVIEDGDRTFVSHCGWGQGGVYLAELTWS